MRIMFQPDALHHQAPSDHTRHHHTLSGPPEKTSGFNIPNAPTASLHAARCTLHAQLTTTRPQLSVKLSLLPSRHDTASPPFPTQTPCPPFLSSPLPPTLHAFAALHPQPRSRIRVAALTHPPARHPIQRHNEYKPLPPHLPRHTSLATSLPATSTPAPRPKPSTAASMHSHIGPRPTRIQRFLHMPPAQPH